MGEVRLLPFWLPSGRPEARGSQVLSRSCGDDAPFPIETMYGLDREKKNKWDAPSWTFMMKQCHGLTQTARSKEIGRIFRPPEQQEEEARWWWRPLSLEFHWLPPSSFFFSGTPAIIKGAKHVPRLCSTLLLRNAACWHKQLAFVASPHSNSMSLSTFALRCAFEGLIHPILAPTQKHTQQTILRLIIHLLKGESERGRK